MTALPRAERLSALIDVLTQMAEVAMDLPSLAAAIAQNVARLDGATGAAVRIWNEGAGIWAASGDPALESAADFDGDAPASVIAMPLPPEGDAVGMLWVYSRVSDAFTPEDTVIVERFASIAGAVINLSLQFNRKLYESRTDELTGLQNRRAFEERLTHAMHEYRRYGKPFALVIADLDGFKSINDRFGHAKGDVALSAVANVMRGEMRASDEIFRVGGDEFAILLPNGNTGVAEILMARLCACVNGTEGLSISYGIAQPVSSDVEGTLKERADQALYLHKRRRA